jgi:hypothetical protein
MYAFTLVLVAPLWAGVRVMQMGAVPLGFGVVLVALVTIALWFRFVRRQPDPAADGSFEITQEHVEYAVWAAVGAPFILIGLLLVWLLLSGSTRT